MSQVVLYTDEMEAITVIDLPQSFLRGLREGIYMRVPVQLPPALEPCENRALPDLSFQYVEIWAERFVRKGRDTWLLFTRNDELALLLKSDVLPGQRAAYQSEFRRGFVAALIQTLG